NCHLVVPRAKKPSPLLRVARACVSLQFAAPYSLGKATKHVCLAGLRRPFEVMIILRKEVIQPQVPLRLPCYDLVPIRSFIFGACDGDFGCPSLSWLDGRCVQGSGTHSPQCC